VIIILHDLIGVVIDVSLDEAMKVVNLLNLRPRKCLGYKTPVEVFKELTGVTLIFNSNGALIT